MLNHSCIPGINPTSHFISSGQFSHSVMSISLWPHGLQQTRLTCPSPTPGACSNWCPSSQWWHPTILSSASPFPPAFSLSQQQGLFQWVRFFFFNFFIFFICSGFCHTLKWNSHGFKCGPHPNPPSHLPLHPLPLGLPSAPGPSACLMYPTWAGDLFHPR